VTNTGDSCTTLNTTHVGLGNHLGNLDAGETLVTAVTSPLAAGLGTVTLGAPGAGNNGSVDAALNLGVGGTADACPAFAPAAAGADRTYLRGQWCGAAATRDPAARARFGIRRGDETIYIRESVN
jgi:MSHA biogenesis protein MshQ